MTNDKLTIRISKKGFALGPFMKTTDPAFVEIAGYSGFDFVILDMEHGPAGIQEMQNLVRAATISGLISVIRTRDRSPESISQALDIGADAIQVPQICTAEAAASVVKSARFYPSGSRGVCRFVRAANYSSTSKENYFETSNKKNIIIQIEGIEAIKNIDAILEVPGIDIIFIGPYDLSQALGFPGQINHPMVISHIMQVLKKASLANKFIGIFSDTIQDARLWLDLGVHYLSYSVDVGIFLSACKTLVEKIHGSKPIKIN
jgi:4-hydroxy-2-oxoheptanedioate aldolase